MITNGDITIYNRKANPEKNRMEYVPTIIKNVWFHTEQKTNTTANGLVSADSYTVRIPMAERATEYLSPEKYAVLTYGEHLRYWTVENGDIFVRGNVVKEISSPSDLVKEVYLVGEVVSHAVNSVGLSPHIRIGGR